MNWLINTAVLGGAFLIGLTYCLVLIAIQNKGTNSILSRLNASFLLIVNAGVWCFVSFYYMQSPDNLGFMPIYISLAAMAVAWLEYKFPNMKPIVKWEIYGAIFLAIAIFLMGVANYALLAFITIYCASCMFTWEKFNTPYNHSSIALFIILGGLSFLSIFYGNLGEEFSYIMLASALLVLSFSMFARYPSRLAFAPHALKGFSFIACWGFAHLAAQGYLYALLIIPMYYFTEHLIVFGKLALNKLRSKNYDTRTFYERATTKHPNAALLDKFISIRLVFFIIIATIANEQIILVIIGLALVIDFQIIHRLSRWGVKDPTFKELFSTLKSDVKAAYKDNKVAFSTILGTKKDKKGKDK